MAATNTHDFGHVERVLAPDAVYFFGDATCIGVSEVRGYFERTWAMIPDETYWAEDIQLAARSEDTAVATYTYHWRGTIDGQERCGAGRATNVWAGEFVEVTRECVTHVAGGFGDPVPKPLHCDAVDESAQASRFVFMIATGAEATALGEDVDGDAAGAVNRVTELDRCRTKRVIGQGEDAELYLRDELRAPFIVKRQKLCQKRLDQLPPGATQCEHPGGNSFLNEYEAVLPQSMLRRERSPEGGDGDPGFCCHTANGQACQAVALEHAQRGGGDLRGARFGVDAAWHGYDPGATVVGFFGQIV